MIDSLAYANPDYYVAGSTRGQYEASALKLYKMSHLHFQLS